MLPRFYFLAAIALVVSAFGASEPVTPDKALALVCAVPEFVELKQRLKDDVNIDGPDVFTPGLLHRVALGSRAYQIDVYVTVHDDAETAHATRWAFFQVNATNGDIWVSDFDFDSGNFVLRPLSEWQRRRHQPRKGSK